MPAAADAGGAYSRPLHLIKKAARVLGLGLDEVFIEASRLPPDMQRDVRSVTQAYRKFKQSED